LLLRDDLLDPLVELPLPDRVNDEDSLLWRMDAKLAEYCLVGEAAREGWI